MLNVLTGILGVILIVVCFAIALVPYGFFGYAIYAACTRKKIYAQHLNHFNSPAAVGYALGITALAGMILGISWIGISAAGDGIGISAVFICLIIAGICAGLLYGLHYLVKSHLQIEEDENAGKVCRAMYTAGLGSVTIVALIVCFFYIVIAIKLLRFIFTYLV